MPLEMVSENLKRVRGRIAAACDRAGRSVDEVTLVAVSKRIPLEKVAAAYAAGQRVFGENRVQDAVSRLDELPRLLESRSDDPAGLVWHFIGNIQANKARKVVGGFELLEAVDSLALARRLGRIASENGVVQPVLMEINASGESNKHGLVPDEAPEAVIAAAAVDGIEVRGLMTMARFGADEAELRATFSAVRELASAVRSTGGPALPELSMGMSGDFESAIAEGSTMVRVGTAIFGPRS